MQTQQQAKPDRVVLTGSEKHSPVDAEDLGAVDPNQEADVTVHLRSKISDSDFTRIVNEMAAKPPSERKYLSREELAELRGASPEDVARVKAFANNDNLTVANVDAAARTITLHGKLSDLQNAFGVQLRNYRQEGNTFRARTGSISLPTGLAPAVQGVFGLDTRPVARPR